MRRSFTPLLSSVRLHHLLVVDRQPLVGVDRHTEQPRVRLSGIEDALKMYECIKNTSSFTSGYIYLAGAFNTLFKRTVNLTTSCKHIQYTICSQSNSAESKQMKQRDE